MEDVVAFASEAIDEDVTKDVTNYITRAVFEEVVWYEDVIEHVISCC